MKYRKDLQNKKAFTVMEIIVVIVIMGVMAGLITPNFRYIMESVRSGEGVRVLTAVLTAQRAYAVEYGQYSGSLSQLDVEIPPLRYFHNPIDNEVSTQNPIAHIHRDQDGIIYNLRICADGQIICDDYGAEWCEKVNKPENLCPVLP